MVGDHLDVPLGQRNRMLRVADLRPDERVDPLHGPERDAGDERVVPVLACQVRRGRGAALPGPLGDASKLRRSISATAIWTSPPLRRTRSPRNPGRPA